MESIENDVDARIVTREIGDPHVVVLSLADPYMNYASADVIKPMLKAIVADYMAEGRTCFVLNLGNVGVMDSCGLAVLVSMKKLVDGRGGRMALSNLSAMIQRLFALTRLDKAFDIYPSEDQAVAAV